MLLVLFSLVIRPVIQGAEEAPLEETGKQWDLYVGSFRKGHNLGGIFSYATGLWQAIAPHSTVPLAYNSRGYVGTFDYAYHLPIYRGLGYLLGSSMGMLYETGHPTTKDFVAKSSYQLPGVKAGLVLNATSRLRFLAGVALYLERMENFTLTANGVTVTEFSTLRVFPDRWVAMDWFCTLRMAVRLEGHYRSLLYSIPRNAEDKPTDFSLHKEDYWIGIGIIYHDL